VFKKRDVTQDWPVRRTYLTLGYSLAEYIQLPNYLVLCTTSRVVAQLPSFFILRTYQQTVLSRFKLKKDEGDDTHIELSVFFACLTFHYFDILSINLSPLRYWWTGIEGHLFF
jgi:hypothetical protein